MNKLLIANWGKQNQGKSKTLLRVYEALKERYDQSNQPMQTDGYNDIQAIIKVQNNNKEIKIGIETCGDPYSRHADSIKALIAEGCDIIITACRTKGDTYNRIWEIQEQGDYSVIWIQNSRTKDDSLHEMLNKNYVEHILNIINSFLDSI